MKCKLPVSATIPFYSCSGGETGYVDQVHLSYLLMHGVDADLARIGIPARMKITSIRFTEIRVGVKTADIESPIVNIEPTNPDEEDPQSGVYKAKKDGEEKEAINPGQYHNEDNPKSHERWTAQQIWEQTAGNIDIFCAGLGTTGTVIGNSRFLKSKKQSLQVVGAIRAPDQYVPGVRTEKLLKLVGFDWQKHVDSIERVDTVVSYQLSMELSRQGIVVGPSSGLALAGLLQYLTGLKQQNKLEELRDNQSDDVVCAFLCPDGPLPYLDEYFKYLDSSNFPAIQNEELMLNKP